MRLQQQQIDKIKASVRESISADFEYQIRLFGSRVDDQAKGGDIDILVSVMHELKDPATIAARIAAKAIMKLDGQKIDVVLEAPNLKQLPIHYFARKEGILL